LTGKKVATLNFFNDKEARWELRRVEIDYDKNSLCFTNTNEKINLNHYILRKSNKKDKAALAL
jgi:hypothetical protein